METNSNALKGVLPEVIAKVRQEFPNLAASDEEIASSAALIASVAYAVFAQPQAMVFARMGPSAMAIYAANTFADSFIGALLDRGVINGEAANRYFNESAAAMQTGRPESEISRELWGTPSEGR